MPPSPPRAPPLWALPALLAFAIAPAAASDRPLLTPADALAPATPDVDAPALEPDEPEGLPQDEPDEAGGETTRESSKELASERSAELGYTGGLAADAPVEFYLDPLGATQLDPLHLERIDPSEFDIPVVVNDAVKKWMMYFLGNGRKYFGRYLMRSTRWLPMMHAEIEARGMPRDLVYLAMIESGFTTSATSYASAAGLWQFMPATGRQYHLRVDWWVDDRRDPTKATHAALDYLSYLNKLFEGDWWLAWASYNGGEGRVMKETRRHGTTDFWTLVSRGALHSETQNYVPKLIAAAIIGKHPDRYGFVGVPYQEAFAYEEATIPGATGLDIIARSAGVTEDALLDLNPGLRRWALPPDVESWVVRLPPGTGERFAVEFAKVPADERVTLVRHIVKRKESLGSIAKKYGVSADDVARLNHLKPKSKIKIGQELLVPARPGDKPGANANAAPTSEGPPTPSPGPVRTHTVRSGDTLSGIAAKYDVSVAQLQALNDLQGDTILSGQKLKVSTQTATKGAEAVPEADTPRTKPATAKSVTHSVRRGDTLGSIAARYDCSVAQLKSWNGIKGTTIYPGQKLRIRR
ncbi:MAG: LysM peptidoglycan-binding domain-containing protein [Myxococcales bacterium]|nr:LysM peptidoglycan-binding domain-containing protein [Myxococcales bacterium]